MQEYLESQTTLIPQRILKRRKNTLKTGSSGQHGKGLEEPGNKSDGERPSSKEVRAQSRFEARLAAKPSLRTSSHILETLQASLKVLLMNPQSQIQYKDHP